jgi:hypothetical protein
VIELKGRVTPEGVRRDDPQHRPDGAYAWR